MGKSILSKIAIAAAMLFPASGLLGGSAVEAKVVKGQVTSAADGEALIGATVKLEESTAATVTDLDGNFQINAEDGQHIVVSYIGYVTKTVTVRGDFLAIKLDEEASTLDDVVVIGYGVQKKKLVTGATTQLKGEDIAKLNTNNALQAMQGQTPGVNIISESGQPGSDMKVIIRGQGSNTSNSPHYIIDGIPGDLKNINPRRHREHRRAQGCGLGGHLWCAGRQRSGARYYAHGQSGQGSGDIRRLHRLADGVAQNRDVRRSRVHDSHGGAKHQLGQRPDRLVCLPQHLQPTDRRA